MTAPVQARAAWVRHLRHAYEFPDPRQAAAHGLLAVGGDYQPERLLAAYVRGIFPWPSDELPYAWFSPDPRFVLEPEALHVSRSLRRTLNQTPFEIRFDTAFEDVMRACAEQPRPDQQGTWISEPLIEGFVGLHDLGFAHSVEAWRDDRLVGGMYGVAIGGLFCGESMFYRKPDASKVALVHLVRRLAADGFLLLDCQTETPHLARLGAEAWSRTRFLATVDTALERPTLRGRWS